MFTQPVGNKPVPGNPQNKQQIKLDNFVNVWYNAETSEEVPA